MLLAVVQGGTGIKAQIPGYQVAGKTGTAEKVLPNGQGYSTTDFVASFIGMVPAAHPKLLVMVAVNEPHRPSYFGGDIAAPAVQKIMQLRARPPGDRALTGAPRVAVTAAAHDGGST